jgi:hypothetical protein
MKRTFWGALTVACLLTTAAAAQQAQQRTTQPAQQQQKPTPAPTEPAATIVPREPPGQPINIRFELTISDQISTTEAAKRTFSVVVADRAAGSVRGANGPWRLNVDVTPQMLNNGNVRAMIGLEYMPRQLDAKGEPLNSGTLLNERITAVLEPGKPLVISQAADPQSDRKISVEVRATILK